MNFYILQNDGTKGPYTIGQMRSMWSTGAITSDTLYCQAGADQWLPLAGIVDQLEPPPAVAQQANGPASSGGSEGNRACPHCGSHQVGKVRGLQGVGEVLIGVILACLCLVPGIVYYIYKESVPFCSGCGRRV